MKRAWCLIAALPGIALAQPVPAPTPPPLQRSISVSQQFVIYHPDKTLRSRIARKAEDVKRELLQSLRLKDEWTSPIIIQIVSTRTSGTPRLQTGLFESDGGQSKLQIDVFDPVALRSTDFDRELLRAMLLEFSFRTVAPKAGKAFQQPPAWLLEGIHEDLMAKKDEGITAALYERLVNSGPPPKLEAFLKERPEMMDATTKAIYQARAMALYRALVGLPDGAKSLVSYVTGLQATNPTDAKKLIGSFPSLEGESTNLSKAWTLSLANASATDRIKPLTLAQSQAQLATIFDFVAPKNPKNPSEELITGPAALQAVARTEAGPYVNKQKADELLRLEARAHPMIRPIVEEYRLIATELAAKPKKNLEKRLTKNMELHQAVVQRGSEVEDYINWFEAAKLETSSKEFDNLFEGVTYSQMPPRNDAISRVMDEWEGQGW